MNPILKGLKTAAEQVRNFFKDAYNRQLFMESMLRGEEYYADITFKMNPEALKGLYEQLIPLMLRLETLLNFENGKCIYDLNNPDTYIEKVMNGLRQVTGINITELGINYEMDGTTMLSYRSVVPTYVDEDGDLPIWQMDPCYMFVISQQCLQVYTTNIINPSEAEAFDTVNKMGGLVTTFEAGLATQ